ncbi:hypothetical protein [Burkholderia stagnalis]|uniref:hypothetical protein n=1 Tax=Burkholderia stagnalis TaxID=1503054 RepID=UPI000A4B1585|nr:hypothetical protein [Burkholderia stagnalis]
MADEKVNTHDFWWRTCGLDTHRRGSGAARTDTPWNTFTSDDRALVCTLWADCIASVTDPADGSVRRFIRLGGKSREWKGIAVTHGEDARRNLERAIAERKPIFGYEAEPQPAALKAGERKVKHFYLNRVSQLKGWIGLRLHDLKERLNIDGAFERLGIMNDTDPNMPASLFELVETTTEIPRFPDQPAVAPENALRQDSSAEAENEENLVNQEDEGNLSSDEYARLALSILIEHVLLQSDNVMAKLTYRELAERLERRNKHGDPWPRGLGHVLGRVTALVERAGAQCAERPPFLTCVVVLSSGGNAGLPGVGVSNEWPGYEALSRADKEAKLMREYERILNYGSRWNDVLRLAGLPEVTSVAASDRTRTGGWGGGESEAHKALKQYVLAHPELFDAPADCVLRETEHALRSGDAIDVIFKSDHLWVGVEVKSRVSNGNIEDYARGLFQVIKYQAVLEAQARTEHPDNPPKVRVLLALESRLPDVHRGLAVALGVTYLEEVTPVELELT